MAYESLCASLYALQDKAVDAQTKKRFARAADLFGRAAVESQALCEPDSLVTAHFSVLRADCLTFQAEQPGVSPAENTALNRECWEIVTNVTLSLLRRHAARKLMPGDCRREEEYQLEFHRQRNHGAVCPLPILAAMASCYGVDVFQKAARLTLFRMHPAAFRIELPPLDTAEFIRAQSFVELGIDLIAATRHLNIPFEAEVLFAASIKQLLAKPGMDPAFHASLQAKWTSPAVVAGLRAHKTLEIGESAIQKVEAKAVANECADVLKHGLLVCAFPCCDKREASVHQFKICSACKAVAYCSAEHGALHWSSEHKNECNSLKVKGTKLARADKQEHRNTKLKAQEPTPLWLE